MIEDTIAFLVVTLFGVLALWFCLGRDHADRKMPVIKDDYWFPPVPKRDMGDVDRIIAHEIEEQFEEVGK